MSSVPYKCCCKGCDAPAVLLIRYTEGDPVYTLHSELVVYYDARLCQKHVDPMIADLERRACRYETLPVNAPLPAPRPGGVTTQLEEPPRLFGGDLQSREVDTGRGIFADLDELKAKAGADPFVVPSAPAKNLSEENALLTGRHAHIWKASVGRWCVYLSLSIDEGRPEWNFYCYMSDKPSLDDWSTIKMAARRIGARNEGKRGRGQGGQFTIMWTWRASVADASRRDS